MEPPANPGRFNLAVENLRESLHRAVCEPVEFGPVVEFEVADISGVLGDHGLEEGSP
jgi:hypothetical protein